MLESKEGVNDGEVYPSLYTKDQEFEIGDDLAKTFLSIGACVEITDSKKSTKDGYEDKEDKSDYEDKSDALEEDEEEETEEVDPAKKSKKKKNR